MWSETSVCPGHACVFRCIQMRGKDAHLQIACGWFPFDEQHFLTWILDIFVNLAVKIHGQKMITSRGSDSHSWNSHLYKVDFKIVFIYESLFWIVFVKEKGPQKHEKGDNECPNLHYITLMVNQHLLFVYSKLSGSSLFLFLYVKSKFPNLKPPRGDTTHFSFICFSCLDFARIIITVSISYWASHTAAIVRSYTFLYSE